MSTSRHTRWIITDEHRATDAYRFAGLRMRFAQAVYDRRAALGWTTAQLAAAAGMDEADIEAIEESGTEPTIPLLQRLAQAMNARVTLHITPDPGDEPPITFEAA